MNIELHIERLILDGLDIPRHQLPQLQAAIETELAQLLTDGGLHSELLSVGALPSLRVSPIQASGDSNPTQLGQQIARSLYSGLGSQKAGKK